MHPIIVQRNIYYIILLIDTKLRVKFKFNEQLIYIFNIEISLIK